MNEYSLIELVYIFCVFEVCMGWWRKSTGHVPAAICSADLEFSFLLCCGVDLVEKCCGGASGRGAIYSCFVFEGELRRFFRWMCGRAV